MLIELTLLSGAAAYWLRCHRDKSHPGIKIAESGHKSRTKKFSSKQLFKDAKSALSGYERQQQLGTNIDNLNEGMQKAQQEVNRNLLISVGTVTTALLGGILPLFTVLSAMGVLYLSRDVFRFGVISKLDILSTRSNQRNSGRGHDCQWPFNTGGVGQFDRWILC